MQGCGAGGKEIVDAVCSKCSGQMAMGTEGDFYLQVYFLKCLNCGKTIYHRPTDLQSEKESVPMEKMEYPEQ
jgi:hypothetical protein